jgi:hypothetical protein
MKAAASHFGVAGTVVTIASGVGLEIVDVEMDNVGVAVNPDDPCVESTLNVSAAAV